MSSQPPGPTEKEAVELLGKLEAAEAVIDQVTWASGYPVYPKAFRDFTEYISRSPWHRKDYVEDMKSNLSERMESLDLGEVRSYLTFLVRVDRFSPGGLLGQLENGDARRLVERAASLVG